MRAVINPSGGDGGHETAQQEHPEPPQWEPVTLESVELEIGLVQRFFKENLTKSETPYLIEDENLPVKLRLAKPRLPPTGKINTPRKRKDGPNITGSAKKKKKSSKPPQAEPPAQLPTPPMAIIREEEGSDVESLFG
jgi:transcriptional activator SPT7